MTLISSIDSWNLIHIHQRFIPQIKSSLAVMMKRINVFNWPSPQNLLQNLVVGGWEYTNDHIMNRFGRQTQWWPRHKAIYFSWFGPELFCLLLGPPGFNCWFSSAPVFQWCCSTPQGSPGVGRNTFLSSPHLCFIIVFICDLFVSRDDPLMS